MPATSKGLCKYCGQEFAKSGMGRHLNACKDRKAAMEPSEGEDTCEYVQLLISGTYAPDYWLIVDVRADATLGTLDQFLRDIWLECCGHLSGYTIAGVRYESHVDDFWDDPSETGTMDVTLKEAFNGVDTATYEYDYGSTTALTIKVQGWHTGKCLKEPVTVLSRNKAPVIACSECGKPAEWVNPEEMWGDPAEAAYCSKCIKEAADEDMDDEDDEEYDDDVYFEEYLPICNSPRCGVCGYEGSTRYPDEFMPDKLLPKMTKKKTTKKTAKKKA